MERQQMHYLILSAIYSFHKELFHFCKLRDSFCIHSKMCGR